VTARDLRSVFMAGYAVFAVVVWFLL